MIDRRKFLKRVGQVLAGEVVLSAKVKEPKYEASGCPSSSSSSLSASVESSTTITKGLSANDICNEALRKIGEYPIGALRFDDRGRTFRYMGNESGYKNKGSFAYNGDDVVGGRVSEGGWMQVKGIMDVYYLKYG